MTIDKTTEKIIEKLTYEYSNPKGLRHTDEQAYLNMLFNCMDLYTTDEWKEVVTEFKKRAFIAE